MGLEMVRDYANGRKKGHAKAYAHANRLSEKYLRDGEITRSRPGMDPKLGLTHLPILVFMGEGKHK